MDKVSVVTVSYNEEKSIEMTLKSVLSQSYENYEYILKDGGSTDQTNSIIENYASQFYAKGCSFIHLHHKDNGIYDAMNQAEEYCSGKWIIYMNAGDYFFDENVLTNVFNNIDINNADILYGHTLCKLRNGNSFIIRNDHMKITQGIGISQQVCFYKREILERRKFQEKYKILADFEYWVYLIEEQKLVIKPLNIIIAVYNREGISSTDTYASFCEKSEILGWKKNRLMCLKENIKMWFGNMCPTISDILYCMHMSKKM